ncbi:hypothetical protein ACLMJK_009355 [Lecanora helva]
MGSPSALIGNPPLNPSDLDIIKGLQKLLIAGTKPPYPPMPPPEQGMPFGTPRPPPAQYRVEGRRPQFIGLASVIIIIMTFVTGLRLAIRAQNAKIVFGKDDLAVAVGTAMALVIPVLFLAQVSYGGMGKHIYDLTYHELYVSHMLGATQTTFLFVSLGVIKISIILLYMRVSGFTSRMWMAVHWFLLSVVVSYCLGSLFVMVFTCSPIGIYFNLRAIGRMQHPLTCIDQSKALAVLSATHVVTDFSLLAIPIALLWKVQMKWTKKLRIWLAGLFGLSSCSFALLRTITQYVVQEPDPTYDTVDMVVYLMLDVTTAVIAASLPVLSVLVTRMQHRYLEYRSSGQRAGRLPLRGDSDPIAMPRRKSHRTSIVDITRLESRSSSDVEDIHIDNITPQKR